MVKTAAQNKPSFNVGSFGKIVDVGASTIKRSKNVKKDRSRIICSD